MADPMWGNAGYEDPFQNPDEGEMLRQYAMLASNGFALPGNTPQQRLNYLQDLEQSLGFSPIQLAGVTNPAVQVPQWEEPLNITGQMYGADPVYGSIFRAIDEDQASPIAAAKAAMKQAGIDPQLDKDTYNQAISVATDYAREKFENQQKRANWERENAGQFATYTAPDGSRYKNSPMGGNDIYGTASEYELLGAPNVDELMKQYAQSRSPRQGPRQSDPSFFNAPAAFGLASKANAIAGQVVNALGGGVGPEATSVGPEATSVWTNAGRRAQEPTSKSVKPTDFFEKMDKKARKSLQARLDTAKQTNIRSDANRNAMNRIMALAAALQGPFPSK